MAEQEVVLAGGICNGSKGLVVEEDMPPAMALKF